MYLYFIRAKVVWLHVGLTGLLYVVLVNGPYVYRVCYASVSQPFMERRTPTFFSDSTRNTAVIRFSQSYGINPLTANQQRN